MYRQTDGQTDGVQQLMRPLDRVALTITFQYRVNERFVRFVTDRQTDITKKTKHFVGEIYSKIRDAAANFDLILD